MIIKKYLVRDMEEAVRRAKLELGNDAIIVTQRRVRDKGLAGLVRPRLLEVTMAVESEENRPSARKRTSGKAAVPQTSCPPEASGATAVPADKVRERSTGPVEAVRRTLPEDEQMRAYILGRIQTLEEYRIFNASVSNGRLEDSQMLPVFISHYLREQLDGRKYDNFMHERAVAFLGSTGVGKTTTIAKIAATAKLRYGKKVGFITIDTYRIGAVEQLKIYSDIMDVPMEKVMEPQDMPKALERLADCDLILIDTLGTSYRNREQLDNIQQYLKGLEEIRKTVVLNTTMDLAVFERALDTYEQYDVDYTIFTKLDEMDNPYRLLEYLDRNQAPLAYICTGQSVPDDLQEASGDGLLSYLWKEGQA